MKSAQTPQVSLVLLTWNEIDGLQHYLPLLTSPKELGLIEILAVDGGSTDGSLELYQKHQIKVVQQRSRGRGEAMRLAAKEAQGDYLIFFSPDGNEDLKDISMFLKAFKENYNLVIASRMMKGATNEEDIHFLKPRKWANNIFNWFANFLFNKQGTFITDSINGYRGIKKSLLSELQLTAIGYTIEYQMTIRCFKKNISIYEFPTHEGQRIGGETKAASIPTGLRFLNCLWEEFIEPKSSALKSK